MTGQKYMMRYAAGNYWIICADADAPYIAPLMTNEAGCCIWNCLMEQGNVEKAAQELMQRYSVSYEQALSDAEAFVRCLEDRQMKEIVKAGM